MASKHNDEVQNMGYYIRHFYMTFYAHHIIMLQPTCCIKVDVSLTGFEEKFLLTEESCVKAIKRLPEFDLYISTVLPLENKGIR